MRARVFLGFLTLLAPLLAAGQGLAQPTQPLDRLLPQIRRDHPGQFLDAEGVNEDGNPHYRLKWLTQDGRVIYLDADARTGRVNPSRERFGFQRPRDEAQGGPPDRGGEGRDEARSYGPRNEQRPDESRFNNRRQFGASSGDGGEERGFTRRSFDPRGGDGRPGIGNRFERSGGNGRDFGGGFGRADRGGNRDFGGGGRERRGNGR